MFYFSFLMLLDILTIAHVGVVAFRVSGSEMTLISEMPKYTAHICFVQTA